MKFSLSNKELLIGGLPFYKQILSQDSEAANELIFEMASYAAKLGLIQTAENISRELLLDVISEVEQAIALNKDLVIPSYDKKSGQLSLTKMELNSVSEQPLHSYQNFVPAQNIAEEIFRSIQIENFLSALEKNENVSVIKSVLKLQ
jgi:hypothetical protein